MIVIIFYFEFLLIVKFARYEVIKHPFFSLQELVHVYLTLVFSLQFKIIELFRSLFDSRR